MTPYEIEVLLHYHCSNMPFERSSAPIFEETIKWFVLNDILAFTDEKLIYKVTERGLAHVQQLCDTSLPSKIYVRSDGTKIKPDNN